MTINKKGSKWFYILMIRMFPPWIKLPISKNSSQQCLMTSITDDGCTCGVHSPIAGSLPKGMWLTRRSISIIQESLTRFEKFVNHQSLSERTCWVFSTRTHVDFLIKSRNFSVPIQTPVTLWQSWHWHLLPAIIGHRTGLIFYQRLLPAALNNLIEICHFWDEK